MREEEALEKRETIEDLLLRELTRGDYHTAGKYAEFRSIRCPTPVRARKHIRERSKMFASVICKTIKYGVHFSTTFFCHFVPKWSVTL